MTIPRTICVSQLRKHLENFPDDAAVYVDNGVEVQEIEYLSENEVDGKRCVDITLKDLNA